MTNEIQNPGSSERRLLIVEDDQRFADTLATEFRDRGYHVEWLESLQAVRDHASLDFHFAVVDLRIRKDSGLDVISSLKDRSPETVVIVLTGYGSIATAVKATKLGATAYLTKPVDADEIERANTFFVEYTLHKLGLSVVKQCLWIRPERGSAVTPKGGR